MFTKAYIPYGVYYSTPFSKWQMTLANEHALELAGATAKGWMAEKGLAPEGLDYLYLGYTVHQRQAFYGAPWVAALLGATGTPGCNVSQACSTSTTCLYYAAAGVENGLHGNALVIAADRTSNGPHVVWPNPKGPGGEVIHENWLMDNFNGDPLVKKAMVETAENVAREIGTTKEECDDVTALRYEQYADALADDRAFQRRYMRPVEVKVSRRKTITLDADEGVTPTDRTALAGLRPVVEGGVLSFGSQTHPADGHAALYVTTRDRARELAAEGSPEVQIVSYGYHRTEPAFMPKAPVPAARMALENAGISIDDVAAIKSHNPFVVNDVYFSREFGVDVAKVNHFGCPLVFGHPQGPTAGRCIIELVEELALKGGGYGLFTGCAAGDSGAALVVKVG